MAISKALIGLPAIIMTTRRTWSIPPSTTGFKAIPKPLALSLSMKQPAYLPPSGRACARLWIVLAGLWTVGAHLGLALSAAENTDVMVKPPVPVPGGLSLH